MSASQPLTGDDHVEVNQLPGMFAPVPEKSWCAADGQPWPCPTVASQPLTGDELAMLKHFAQVGVAPSSESTLRLVAEIERLRADLANVASCLHRDVLAAALGEIPK